jgi:hypothetical protein
MMPPTMNDATGEGVLAVVVGAGEPAVFIHGEFIADTFRPLRAQPGDGYRLASRRPGDQGR